MTSARESVKRINEEVDAVVRTKLDDTAVTQMKQTKDTVFDNASKAKGYKISYSDHVKQAGRVVTDIRQNPKRTDAEIEQALKSVHYQEFPKLIAAIKTEEDNSIKTLKSCEEAKIKATRAMVVNLHTIGKVLLDVEHTQNMIKFLQTGILQSQPQIQELKKITKLNNTYKESLKEIQRRKAYSQKIEGLYKHHEKFFKTLQSDEITKRLAFQANYGPYLLPQLVPFLVKSEQEERNVPVVQLSLRPFDQDIPDVGQLPVSLEDDFSLISDYESNPKEALKRKEEENAQLIEQIQVLLKQTEEKKVSPVSTNQRIVELQKEVDTMREITKSPSRVDPSRTQLLQEENNKLSQQATVLGTQLKQSQNDVQALQKKNQILLSQINVLQQNPSPSGSSIEQYKQRIAELEQKLAKTEETVTRYADPDIRKLHVEMGFPLNLAREALVNNKTVNDAIQWLLEYSHHSAQPPKV